MIKRTIEHIRKLSAADRKYLVELLGGGKKGDTNFISTKLTTSVGFFNVLRSLTDTEYRIFVEACKYTSGITLGQLEIAFKLKREEIDAIVESLEKKLLAFVIKNRQHLHNKSDRLIAFTDIRETFKPQEIAYLRDMYRSYYMATLNAFTRKNQQNHRIATPKSSAQAVIAWLLSSGGIASMKEVAIDAEKKAMLSSIDKLVKERYVTILHTPEPPFDALIALTPKSIQEFDWSPATVTSSHNRYNLLLNILIVHDIISTYGLFITQQNNFRKIDLDRILGGLLPIEGITGKNITRADTFQLCLSLLHRHKMAEISTDSVLIHLTPVLEYMNHPDALLAHLLSGEETINDHQLCAPPFQLPSLVDIRNMMEILIQFEAASIPTILFASVAAHIQTLEPCHPIEVPAKAKKQMDLCQHTLFFLHIIGATVIDQGKISISDIGHALARRLKLSPPSFTHQSNKILYINPDYTVLIPREGLSSTDYYLLLSAMELIKDDVLIHAKITRRSILTAYKRGMNIDSFVQVLETLSKVPLPQNLLFMLKEWTKQAFEVYISQAIIIKANHASFIDELQTGKLQHAIIERLTPAIAIIRKESIDDIVKYARRKDVIIHLFEKTT